MDFLQSLESFSNTKIFTDFSLKNSNGYRVGGKALYYVQPSTVNDLRTVIEIVSDFGIKYKIIGNGTNLLISDKGYKGLIICLKKLKGIKIYNDKVVCSSGENIKSLINFCIQHGFSGLEELSGIPATIGGAVVMNAGAYGKTISDYIESVDFLECGKLIKIDKHELGFSYRTSLVKKLNIPVLSATFNLPKIEGKLLSKELVKYFSVLRAEKQPKGNSCGSVFMNDENYKAGYLIDQVGLKGYSVNKAQVSTKHANFIVTDDGATATDVFNLINHVKARVKEEFNIDLKEEIEYVGEF